MPINGKQSFSGLSGPLGPPPIVAQVPVHGEMPFSGHYFHPKFDHALIKTPLFEYIHYFIYLILIITIIMMMRTRNSSNYQPLPEITFTDLENAFNGLRFDNFKQKWGRNSNDNEYCTIKLCQLLRLIPNEQFKHCNEEMKRERKNNKIGWLFRCRICRITINPLNNTLFKSVNISFLDSLYLTFLFTEMMDLKTALRHTTHSRSTIVAWFKVLRAVCDVALDRDDIVIGGPGLHVEIDETHVSRNKYGRGAPLSAQINKQYVFGGICRETKEFFLHRVNSCNKDTLWPLIKRHVSNGSFINTDGARVYDDLCTDVGRNYGFDFFGHETVIHKDNEWTAEDEDGNLVTTNHIEITWRWLKETIKSNLNDEILDSYVSRYCYFKRFLNDLDPGPRFKRFLKDVIRVLPGPEPGIPDNDIEVL